MIPIDYPFVACVSIMIVSLLMTLAWAMAVHDGKVKLRGARMARAEWRWRLLVRDTHVLVRDQTLSWISGEFHDHLGQVLAVVCSAMRQNIAGKSPQQLVNERACYAELLRECLEDVRQWSHCLSGSLVHRGGLREALEAHLAYAATAHQLRCELQFPEKEPDVDPATAHALSRSVQQCLHNTAWHAQASRVMVSVFRPAAGILALDVADDGAGIPEGEVLRGSGMGLATIRERLGQLGGSMVVTTGHGKGFHLFITLKTKT